MMRGLWLRRSGTRPIGLEAGFNTSIHMCVVAAKGMRHDVHIVERP